jgi:hypothetical protein
MKPERVRLCAAAPACVTAMALAGSGLRAQASPSPIIFNNGSWQVSLGGYFKLSLIHDFNAIGSPDVFDLRSIPVDGSKGTNTRITARETRLSLGIKGPVEPPGFDSPAAAGTSNCRDSLGGPLSELPPEPRTP